MGKTILPKTLAEVILNKVQSKKGITFIDGVDEEVFVPYRELLSGALGILDYLQAQGLGEGDELVFQLNNNRNFLSVFWACLLGKIIAVPVMAAYIERHRKKLFNVWQGLKQPRLIISQADLKGLESFALSAGLGEIFDTMREKTVFIEEATARPGEGVVTLADEDDLAFIQFSSGSTSQPKGVMLTHRNLVTNVRAAAAGLKSNGREERVLSWMPLTHDMGLIGLHLMPVTEDWDVFTMPTRLFTRRPGLWLEKISEHGITVTGSPNSGYQHVLKFFDLEKQKHLDLSSLCTIFNGAEPISAPLCFEFSRRLAPLGLSPHAIMPTYGLAEASVAVAMSEPAAEVVPVYVDRDSLAIGEPVRETAHDEPGSVCFVECGLAVNNCAIRVVGAHCKPVADMVTGHIQISGDNVTSGYYNNDEKTAEIVTMDGWVNTGDLGFFRNGRLVITGRVKDTIIVQGNTFYAHDIEFICQELDELKYSRIAVCGVYNPTLQSDEIVCFVASRKGREDFSTVAAAIKKRIVKKAGVAVSAVLPVKTIPTTTSGKVQRYQLKERYLSGEFNEIAEQLLDIHGRSH